MDRLRVLEPWVWPPLLMAVIFVLSAQPNLSSGLGLIDLVGRKVVHAAIYAALCFSWWRALEARQTRPSTAVGAALLLSLAYAVSDEYHQTFVDGRSGSVLDLAIDSLGAALAAALRLKRSSGTGELWQHPRGDDRRLDGAPGPAVPPAGDVQVGASVDRAARGDERRGPD